MIFCQFWVFVFPTFVSNVPRLSSVKVYGTSECTNLPQTVQVTCVAQVKASSVRFLNLPKAFHRIFDGVFSYQGLGFGLHFFFLLIVFCLCWIVSQLVVYFPRFRDCAWRSLTSRNAQASRSGICGAILTRQRRRRPPSAFSRCVPSISSLGTMSATMTVMAWWTRWRFTGLTVFRAGRWISIQIRGAKSRFPVSPKRCRSQLTKAQ